MSFNIFQEQKGSHTTHDTCARDTRHTRPNLDDNILKTCPYTGKGRMWRTVEFQRYTQISTMFEQNVPTLKSKWRGNTKNENGTLLPGLELASSKLHPNPFGPAACIFFFREKINALHTAHECATHGARDAACLNLDDNVPQIYTCTGNPELWQAVPFSKIFVPVWAKAPTFRKLEDTWYKIMPRKENPGSRLIHSRRKKLRAHAVRIFVVQEQLNMILGFCTVVWRFSRIWNRQYRQLRRLCCDGHARHTARIEPKPRRLCPDGLLLSASLSVCANGAHPKRYDRNQTKNSHNYHTIYS